MQRNPHLRPYEAYFRRVKHNAEHPKKKRGVMGRTKPWLMSYDEFLTFIGTPSCHYCGAHLSWPDSYTPAFERSNLDRMDNELGYTKDNCVPCCLSCNITKGAKLTYEEMVLVGNHRRTHPRTISNLGGVTPESIVEADAREQRKVEAIRQR